MGYDFGMRYKGEKKDGKKHGQGTCYWPDGAKYVGEWQNDLMHGQGTMNYPNGAKYIGEHKDGRSADLIGKQSWEVQL